MPDFRLVRRPPAVAREPVLDDAQRRVVEHEAGAMLVLAGPGTGKTTTIVEAVRHAVVHRGLRPESILVLTFSRRAAAELRTRIAARVGGTTSEPLALTVHSYAFGLLRRAAAAVDGLGTPRILSGAEQLLAVRTLLRGQAEDGSGGWATSLAAALPTLGFAEEVRDLMQRAQESGLSPRDVAGLGRATRRPHWVAAARFMAAYRARSDLDPTGGTLDYGELVHGAALLLESDSPVARQERAARAAVFVDEYQDTDPAQERLLRALAGDGRQLVVVGDPDQAIYGFRGATVANIRDFTTRFAGPGGSEGGAGPVPTVALAICRRSGPELLALSRVVAGPLPVPAGGAAHRALTPAGELPPGQVETLVADSAAAEAAAVADVLRRAHVLDGLAWSDMAVLVRSTPRHVPTMRRAMAAAGVPVVVAGDEVPLAREPGVRPLLLLLRTAANPDWLDEATAEELLTGPLGGADVVGLRRLRRALRTAERLDGVQRSATPVADAVRDPRVATALRPHTAAPLVRLHGLLAAAHPPRRSAPAASVEDLLWAVWSRSGLARRWQSASLGSGPLAAAADRALDAVGSLFDAAARFTDRLPSAGVSAFLDDLEAQEIPSDGLAQVAVTGDAVRLMTAHRSKGLEWRLVVVAGVQEGEWPDTRLRSSVLEVDSLTVAAAAIPGGSPGGAGGSGPHAAGTAGIARAAEPTLADRLREQALEERRLFYVAVTRATERLVVTAVGVGDDTDERPSRFFEEVRAHTGRPPRSTGSLPALSLPAQVAQLRAAVVDQTRAGPVRLGAAAQLARLASAGVPGADPGEWYGVLPLSVTVPPLDPAEPVRVSPSRLEAYDTCPRRWFLETAVGVRSKGGQRQATGMLVHALATLVTDLGTTDRDAVQRALADRLDRAWPELDDLGPGWYRHHARSRVEAQLRQFAAWHADTGRELLGVELPFEVRCGDALVAGVVDRLERDQDGRAVVTDLKTGSSPPSAGAAADHRQLGMYQLAVAEGGFADHGVTEPGGAALVWLGTGRGATVRSQPPLADAADPRWAHDLLAWAAQGMRQAGFDATVNPGCRNCPVVTSCPARPEGSEVTL